LGALENVKFQIEDIMSEIKFYCSQLHDYLTCFRGTKDICKEEIVRLRNEYHSISYILISRIIPNIEAIND